MEAAAPASDDLVEAGHGVDRAMRSFDSHREPAISGRNIHRPGRSHIEEPGVLSLRVAPHGNRRKVGLRTMRVVEVQTDLLAFLGTDIDQAAHTFHGSRLIDADVVPRFACTNRYAPAVPTGGERLAANDGRATCCLTTVRGSRSIGMGTYAQTPLELPVNRRYSPGSARSEGGANP